MIETGNMKGVLLPARISFVNKKPDTLINFKKKTKKLKKKMVMFIRRANLKESTDKKITIKFKILKKNEVALSKEERAEVMKRKAIWNHGPNGSESPAVWKSIVNNETYYITNTHRAYNVTRTLKGTIARYHDFIKGTA